MTIFRCFVSCFLIILTSLSFADQYVAVVDAGSSGTRMHVFSVPDDLKEDALPSMRPVYEAKVKIGIASLLDDENGLIEVFKPLLDGALAAIVKEGGDASTTPIYIYGTAGMRKLSYPEQTRIYSVVKNYLRSYPFIVKPEGVRTIPGWEEGVYDWITVNYLSHTFKKGQTIGAMDMGGASTQIAYLSRYDSGQKADQIKKVVLARKTYPIFSHSFFKMGQDEFLNTIPSMEACYPTGYEYEKGKKARFNYTQCSSEVLKSLSQFHVSQALLNEHKGRPYIAFSGYFYNFNFFGVDQLPDNVSEIAALYDRSNTECTHKDWEAFQKDYPNVKPDYLKLYCFNAVYMYSLLTSQKNYGFDFNTTAIRAKNELDHTDIDWPVGAGLYSFVGYGL